ncbi:MAG: CHAT domain-containing protein [Symploca sp. SIO1B1]|nr:CHAT domain-containing protein [Symploca sp. SIO1B1]
MKNLRLQRGIALATLITTSIAGSNPQALAAQLDFDSNTIPTEQFIAQGRTVDLLWQQFRDLQGVGRYVEALAILDQILQFQPDSFLAQYWRGDIFNRLGDYQTAIAAYDDAIAIQPDYLLAWSSKGDALYQLQLYQAAITSWQQALTLPATSDYQQQLVSRSIPQQIGRVLLYDLQRYADAINVYNQLVVTDADGAANWLNRGTAFAQLSQYQDAIADFDQALQLEPQNALAWKQRGLALYSLERYQEAIASWENAARFNPNDLEVTELLSAIANSDTSVAQLDASQQRLAEIRREINLEEERLTALRSESQELTQQLESSQAQLQESQQELVDIEAEVETAQAQLESSQSELSQSQQELTEIEAEVETAQAQLESSQAQLQESQQELAEIEAEVETAQAQLESSQSELSQSQQELVDIEAEVETAQAQLESSQAELSQSQQELVDIEAEVETAQAQLESSQAELSQSQQELSEIEQEFETAQTEFQQSQQELTEIQQEVETAQSEVQQSQQQLAETQQEVQIAQGQLESSQVARLEVGFTSEYEQYFGITNTPITSLEDTRELLRQIEEENDVKSAFLYARYMPSSQEEEQEEDTTASALKSFLRKEGRRQEAGGRREESLYRQLLSQNNLQEQENDELELVLITAEGNLIRQRLGATRAEIRRVAEQFRRRVTDVKDPKGYLAPAQELYQLLMEPLEENLQTQEIQNVAFLMDKGLRSLPLAALHDGEEFLVEKYGIGIMPGLSLANLGPVDVRSSQVLGMGAEEFPDQSPLPAVPIELDVITSKLWPGEAYLNESFTVENLKQAREQEPFSIVHFATHAEFRGGRPSNSYIQLWDEKLTIDQLRQLELSNPPVSLLVLSACRTAVGSDEAELGFAGLAVQAGVSTAMGSLWYVSDEGTLGLMTKFYEELKQIPIKAEALRQTQLAMLRREVRIEDNQLVVDNNRIPLPPELAELTDKDFSHPYYWSAFTLIGNPW